MKSKVRILAVITFLFFSQVAKAQDPTAQGPFTVLTAEYNRGDEAFSCPASSNCVVPSAELRAEVYYPSDLASGPFPLLIFLHGRHTACYNPGDGQWVSLNDLIWPCSEAGSEFVSVPSYRGYDYLGKVLASHGYIVASISANGINAQDAGTSNQGIIDRAHLVDAHFRIWHEFNTVGSSTDGGPFTGDFIGAVDLQRAGTLGHSRGGDGVVKHFALFDGSPDYTVKSVLAIAPTNFSGEVITNVDLGVLLGYCDGDVYTLEGSLYYDRARYLVDGDESSRFTFLSLGANHNFFNTVWTPECWASATQCWTDARGTMPAYPATKDNAIPRFDADPFCASDAVERLTGPEQQAVGLAYIAGFFRYTIGGETELLPLLVGDHAPPATSSPVYVGYHPPDSERLDLNRLNDASELSQTTLTGTGGARGAVAGNSLVTYQRCGYDFANACFPADMREVHLSNFTSLTPGLSRLRVEWDAATDGFVNNLPAGARDVSRFGTLQFRVGVDHTDASNPSLVEFSITLEDGSTSASVSSLSYFGLNDLYFPPGDEAATTIMNTLRVPLNLFSGIDLSDLRRVTLQFNGSPGGTILLSDIAFSDRPEEPAGFFPSIDPNDGKLLAVTGQGITTIDIPDVKLFVSVPPGQTTFSVAIFDGDQTSHFDAASGDPTNTCYRLVTDANKNGLMDPGEEVVAIQSDSYFADSAYTTLYGGPVHASAENGSTGAHFYRLEVVTGPGLPTDTECPSADATKTIIQGFKVKASGQVSIEYGDFSFIAADALGPFSSPDTFMASGANTTYDGIFDFYISVPEVGTPTELTFSDSDADFLGDDTPGVAAGANFEIQYELFDGNGTLVHTNNDVSGNYDVLAGDLDTEDVTVLTGDVGGNWRWLWTDVLTENTIHLWPPVTSPSRLAVYAAPVDRIKVTAAQPIEHWSERPDQIEQYLPIRLGNEETELQVENVNRALSILQAPSDDSSKQRRCNNDHKVSVCHVPPGNPANAHVIYVGSPAVEAHLRHGDNVVDCDDDVELLEDLVAQLLAAELNVAQDASRGQDLTKAFVYGRLEQVSDVLANAHDIVGASLRMCMVAPQLIDDGARVLALLKTINAGEVTFVSPSLEPGTGSTLRATQRSVLMNNPRANVKQSGLSL